jgi:circadian clock protein KaiB
VRKIIGDLSNTERVLVRPRFASARKGGIIARHRNGDSTKAFEDALAERSAEHYLLRLYVTGSTPKSAQAIRNIRAICEEKLKSRYKLEVIDIYQHPGDVKPEQTVVAPTLVKKLPLPVRRIIGDLSNTARVLVGLDIVPDPTPETGH